MGIRKIGWLLLALFSLSSCFKDANFEPGFSGEDSYTRSIVQRRETDPTRRVMIMVSAGHNSLSGYLSEDLKELQEGYLPEGTYSAANVLVVLSRLPANSGDYSTPSAPVLYRMYWDASHNVCRDTLRIWNGDTPLCTRETLHEALTLVRDAFPAKSYGMVFSSHASGWLPNGYYSDPSRFEPSTDSWAARMARRTVYPPIDPYPAVKSLGQDRWENLSYEMELEDFVAAIPMHLEYLLIDACLSGCVEVAYALREKTDLVGFSPTEVLADGFDYTEITRRLLGGEEADPVGVCQEYFERYNRQEGTYRSATISVVDPRKMDALVTVCRDLFEKYRTAIRELPGSRVQGYFRFERHFFYDLRDILVQAGITPEEDARVQAALDACIVYKAATSYFLSIPINTYSGLSM